MNRFKEIKKKIKLFGTSPVAKRSIKYFDYKDSDWLISEVERKNKALEFYAQGLTEEDEGIECGKYGSIAREALKEGG